MMFESTPEEIAEALAQSQADDEEFQAQMHSIYARLKETIFEQSVELLAIVGSELGIDADDSDFDRETVAHMTKVAIWNHYFAPMIERVQRSKYGEITLVFAGDNETAAFSNILHEAQFTGVES